MEPATQIAQPIKPDAGVYNNLGNRLNKRGRFDEALTCYERALIRDPAHPEAHLNRGISLLLRGDLRRGFEEYEWRWRLKTIRPRRRRFVPPQWEGSQDLRGRTILLHAEQGAGDAIQFIRYAPLIAKAGARVLVECRPALMSLLSRVEGVAKVFAKDGPLDAFDFHAPLMSLPRAFGSSLQTIPNKVPYVLADPMQIARWRGIVGRHDSTLNVGLAWAGNPKHKNDHNRSCDLNAFKPLAAVKGVSLFSLQKGPAARQTRDMPAGMRLIELAPWLHTYDDTAAAIANLDLVITVDTSVAHLAGAMGKPTWVLLPFIPDWRWMMKRSDSPWYPTMWLFRQSRPRDWENVIARVAARLSESAAAIRPLDFGERRRTAA